MGIHSSKGSTVLNVAATCSDGSSTHGSALADSWIHGDLVVWDWNAGETRQVPEVAANGTHVLSIPAPTYQCSANTTVPSTYRLALAAGARLPFTVDANSGAVTVAGLLDSESHPYYEFVVLVTGRTASTMFNQSARVRIDVTESPCGNVEWSSTGTYPCTPHTVCAKTQQQEQAPSTTADRVCTQPGTSQPAENDDDGTNAVLTLSLAIAFLAVVILLVVAFACWRRRSRPSTTSAAGASAVDEQEMQEMQEQDLLDEVYADLASIQRVAAYDLIYHGNPLLASPDAVFEQVYHHLQIPLPLPSDLAELRAATHGVLAQTLSPDMCQSSDDHPVLIDAVDFVVRAMADVLADRAIDFLLLFKQAKEDRDAKTPKTKTVVNAAHFLGGFIRSYNPANNPLLEALQTDGPESLRVLRLPVTAAARPSDGGAEYAVATNARHTADYSLAAQQVAGAVYAEASEANAVGVEYSLAQQELQVEYAEAARYVLDVEYSFAAGASDGEYMRTTGSDGDSVYTTADSTRRSMDAVYETAGARESSDAQDVATENTNVATGVYGIATSVEQANTTLRSSSGERLQDASNDSDVIKRSNSYGKDL